MSSMKLEFFVFKWSVIEKFCDYFFGNKFVVFIDNNLLKYLLLVKLGVYEQKWVLQLVDFDFEIKYCFGKQNINVDVLFRFVIDSDVLNQCIDGINILLEIKVVQFFVIYIELIDVFYCDMFFSYLNDDFQDL